MAKCPQLANIIEGRTKKLNETPTLSVGPPKTPMEVPRTPEFKTLGKSLDITELKLCNHRATIMIRYN